MARASSSYGAYIAAGSRVVIVVSKGKALHSPTGYATMPDVVGMTQGDALSALMDEDVQARVFNDYSTRYHRGRVMGQLPLPGAGAPEGSEAVLMVSSGQHAEKNPATVPLPDVVGLDEASAVDRLERAGLSPQVVHDFSSSVTAGLVLAQLPDRVSLAEGPDRPAWWIWVFVAVAVLAIAGVAAAMLLTGGTRVTVPSLTGKTQVEAVQALQRVGLELGSVTSTESSTADEGDVAAQQPAAGAQAKRGDKVDLVIVGGPEMVEVPDVIKDSEKDAKAKLEEAGLSVEVEQASSDDVEKGLVAKQSPSAGDKVAKGTTVRITISTGKAITEVEVPKVSGLTREDAESTLADAGFKVVVAENASADVAQGVVISQAPRTGIKLLKGATVGLVVSSGPPAGEERISVPELVGMKLADAQQALGDAGLSVITIDIDGTGRPEKEVVYQTPGGSAEVAPGATVLLLYSSGK